MGEARRKKLAGYVPPPREPKVKRRRRSKRIGAYAGYIPMIDLYLAMANARRLR